MSEKRCVKGCVKVCRKVCGSVILLSVLVVCYIIYGIYLSFMGSLLSTIQQQRDKAWLFVGYG